LSPLKSPVQNEGGRIDNHQMASFACLWAYGCEVFIQLWACYWTVQLNQGKGEDSRWSKERKHKKKKKKKNTTP